MTNTDIGLKVCPTRIDGAEALFAHKVDSNRCQERQRQRYHKCFTCAYNNSYVAIHGEPIVSRKEKEVDEPTTVEVG